MKTSIRETRDTALVAPREGVIAFMPPAALTGELEVYQGGRVIVVISSSTLIDEVAAPFDCFVLRRLVEEGDSVSDGTPLILLRGV